MQRSVAREIASSYMVAGLHLMALENARSGEGKTSHLLFMTGGVLALLFMNVAR